MCLPRYSSQNFFKTEARGDSVVETSGISIQHPQTRIPAFTNQFLGIRVHLLIYICYTNGVGKHRVETGGFLFEMLVRVFLTPSSGLWAEYRGDSAERRLKWPKIDLGCYQHAPFNVNRKLT